jgi:S1-C subfamily serine protease
MAGSLRRRTPRAAIYALAALALLFNASVIPYALGGTHRAPRKTQAALPMLAPLPPVLRRGNPAWFGIATRTLSPARARRLHIPAYVAGSSVEIIGIAKGSPAARLPLSVGTTSRPGNLILSVDDQPASSPAALRALLERHRPGQQAQLVLVQPEQLDQSINVSVTLDGRPAGADRYQ